MNTSLPTTLPTPLQSYIHKSRYARWLDSEQRRENWSETVDRYVDFFVGRFPDKYPAARVKSAIQSLQCMPSMRALMTAGPALERDEMAGFNCFAGGQRYMTKEGLRSFIDTVGTTQTVLTGAGEWAEAEIKSFGQQSLNKVSFKPVGSSSRSRTMLRREVLVTANHRWITTNRGEVTDLQVGDTVAFVGNNNHVTNKEAFIRGFLFGDGTLDTRGRAYIRICGSKVDRVLPIIKDFGHCSIMYPSSTNGDPVVVFHTGYLTDCKSLPDTKDADYLAQWLCGYMVADGHQDPVQPGISTQSSSAAEFLKETLSYVGKHVTGDNTSSVMETNFGPRSAPLRRLTFRDAGGFVVTAIEESIDTQEVFCAVVPTTGDFVLEGGIHTGNCSYIAVDDIRAFDEILYILMCGTGVGFSVERQSITQLPEIASVFKDDAEVIVVEDSKIGWATAFQELVAMLYVGRVPKWDVSKVRPAGEKLKVFGGRASGPNPLVDLFKFSVALFKGAAGRKLTSVECHDLVCKIADIVVVGGVRRSALISLSNLSDDRMRGAKSGNWWETEPQRALANNSAVYTERPDMQIFLKEWQALIESKSGERGIFNRISAKRKASESGRRNPDFDLGTNPCLTPDMRILTRNGYIAIGTLEGQEVEMWNGFQYSKVTPFSTGVNSIMQVTLSNGAKLKVTPYHKFILADGTRVEAKNLTLGTKLAKYDLPCSDEVQDFNPDAYSQGFYSGDGCTDHVRSYIYEPKYVCIPSLVGVVKQDGDGTRPRKVWIHGQMKAKNFVPSFTDTNYFVSWITGLLDADGTVIHNPNSKGIQLGSVDPAFLNEIRVQLTGLGIHTKVTAEGRDKRTFDGYPTQPFFRLHFGVLAVQALLNLGAKFSRLSVEVETQAPNRDASRFITVTGTQDLEYEEETFCVTEHLNHSMVVEGVMTAQCGEILLRSAGLCNLTEVILRAGDTFTTIKEKVELAVIMGTFQSTLSNFRYVRDIWKSNQEEERLLGVSMTGIMDHEVLSVASPEAETWLSELREHAIAVNKEWAEKLGINQSVAITTVKPSGTVSQLVDSASGIHPRYSQHYIRTVRADKKDPLAQFMRAEGFPVEDCVIKGDTTDVFSFPVAGPEKAVFRNDRTAIQQLNHYLMFATRWCEHNPSITVYVRDHEWLAVGDWVYQNFDKIGGVSFLPFSDHVYQQAPYQEVTEAEFNQLKAKMPEFDWKGLEKFETEDRTENTQTLACTAGVCEMI